MSDNYKVVTLQGHCRYSDSDSKGYPQRERGMLIVSNGGRRIDEFNGLSIPGVVRIHSMQTLADTRVYSLTIDIGAAGVAWYQTEDTHEYWPQRTWSEAFNWLNEQLPPSLDLDYNTFVYYIDAKWPLVADRFDDAEGKEVETQYSAMTVRERLDAISGELDKFNGDTITDPTVDRLVRIVRLLTLALRDEHESHRYS
jgi:hypothetical protein